MYNSRPRDERALLGVDLAVYLNHLATPKYKEIGNSEYTKTQCNQIHQHIIHHLSHAYSFGKLA